MLEALLQGKQVRFSLSFQTPICHEMGDAKPEQKDKEDLEEITTELELADEDELVPYALSLSLSLSLSIYLFAYLDLWLTMIGTKSETPSSNSPWPKPRPSSLHRPRRPRVR